MYYDFSYNGNVCYDSASPGYFQYPGWETDDGWIRGFGQVQPEACNPVFIEGPHFHNEEHNHYQRRLCDDNSWHLLRSNAKEYGDSYGHGSDASSRKIGGMNHGYGSEQHPEGINKVDHHFDFRVHCQSPNGIGPGGFIEKDVYDSAGRVFVNRAPYEELNYIFGGTKAHQIMALQRKCPLSLDLALVVLELTEQDCSLINFEVSTAQNHFYGLSQEGESLGEWKTCVLSHTKLAFPNHSEEDMEKLAIRKFLDGALNVNMANFFRRHFLIWTFSRLLKVVVYISLLEKKAWQKGVYQRLPAIALIRLAQKPGT